MSDSEYLVKPNDRFLRMIEVVEITTLSRAHIYNLVARGNFPQQVKLSAKAAGWLHSEILEWMESRVAESRKLAA